MGYSFITYVRYFVLLLITLAVIYIVKLHFTHHALQFVDKKNILVCHEFKQIRKVVINQDGFNPSQIRATLCDTLIFENKDTRFHQVAFGEHPEHLVYPGFHEKALKPDQSNQVILTAFGTYTIHDHFHDELEAKLHIQKERLFNN